MIPYTYSNNATPPFSFPFHLSHDILFLRHVRPPGGRRTVYFCHVCLAFMPVSTVFAVSASLRRIQTAVYQCVLRPRTRLRTDIAGVGDWRGNFLFRTRVFPPSRFKYEAVYVYVWKHPLV